MAIIFSEGSGINNSVFGKSYEPIKMMIEKKAESFEQGSLLSSVYNIETSDKYAEKISSMTSMNGFQPVGEGGAYPDDEMQEGYSKALEHVTFKDKFTLTEELVEDAQAINLRKRPEAFVTGYYRTRELFGSALVTNVGASVNFRGKKFSTESADKKPLYDKAHPSITGGTAAQSNYFSDKMSADNLAKVETAMQNFKDDNGNVVAVIPDTIIIPNHAALKKQVFEIVGTDKDPMTNNNGFNYLFGRWTVIVNPYWQTTEDSYIVMSQAYNKTAIGGIWFDRIPLNVQSDIDVNTGNNVWRGRARFSAGFNDWRAFAMGGKTGGSTL